MWVHQSWISDHTHGLPTSSILFGYVLRFGVEDGVAAEVGCMPESPQDRVKDMDRATRVSFYYAPSGMGYMHYELRLAMSRKREL